MLGPNNPPARTGLFIGAAAAACHFLGKHILPEIPLWDSLYSIHGVNMQAIISKVSQPTVDIGVGLEPFPSVTSARTEHRKRSQNGINFLRLPYEALLLDAAACFPGLAHLMETEESLFNGSMIEHIDLLRQNSLSHTKFAFHDDANAKNSGPECSGKEDIKITLVLFLMHSADPDVGSRTGIKIAGFPQFDYLRPCSFITLKSLMSHCSRRVSTCSDERQALDTDIKTSFFLKMTRSDMYDIAWTKMN